MLRRPLKTITLYFDKNAPTLVDKVRFWSGWLCWDAVIKYDGKPFGVLIHPSSIAEAQRNRVYPMSVSPQ